MKADGAQSPLLRGTMVLAVSSGVGRSVARLSRRLFVVALVQGICWGLGVCAAIGLVGLGADRFVVVPRLAWPILAAAAAVVIAAACVVQVLRGRRSDYTLVHWLDVQNRYEDVVASAWYFARENDGDPWKIRCMALADALVSKHPPKMPPMTLGRLERPLLVVLSFAVLLGLNVVVARRPKESDARAKVLLDGSQAALQRERLRAATAQATNMSDRQAEELARSMAAVVEKTANGRSTKEELLQDIAKVRNGLGELGGAQPGSGGAAGASQLPPGSPVQAAAQPLRAGDLTGTAAALAQASQALARGELSAGEIDALAKLVTHLAKMPDASGTAHVAQLDAAAQAFARGDLSAAAASLSAAVPHLGTLQPAIKHEALYRDLAKSLAQLEHSVREGGAGDRPAPDGPSTGIAGERRKGGAPLIATNEASQVKGSTGGTAAYQGETGSGSGSSSGEAPGSKGTTVNGQDIAIVGEWSGKTMRELVSAAADGEGAPLVARVVGAHQRVAQVAMRRDDVPEEYRVAVRNYFEAIRMAGEHAWKSSSK